MAFSIKQLLFCMAVVAFGLAAISIDKQILGQLFDLLTLGILIAVAYSAWLSNGEKRAFRVGFLCWAVLYFLLFKKSFDVGVRQLMGWAYQMLLSMTVAPVNQGTSGFGGGWSYFPNFTTVCHCLLLLLLGVVGGWVTVYFYRKRQRMVRQGD